jgi:hypothetical protein
MPQPPGSVPPPPPIGGAKVVVAALSLGVVAVLILSFYIQSVKNQVAAQQFTVFVLDKAIKPGTKIGPKDWKKHSVPDKPVFRDGFKGLNAYISDTGSDDDLMALVKGGKQWEITAEPGAVITHDFLKKPPEFRDKAIDPGKVRIALPVKSKMTPGGLRPGTKVDIAAPMITGGTIPQVMLVMMAVDVKAVGTYTLAEESTGDASKIIRSFNSISIDVDSKTALQLSTLEKMVKAIGDFELYINPDNDIRVQPEGWPEPNTVNPEVLKLINKNLPAK